MRISALASLAALALAGCGDAPERKTLDPLADDPAITAALADEIMVDPDLVGRNRGLSAIVARGPESAEVPPELAGPEAARRARAEAAKLVGGTIREAPEPGSGNTAAAPLRHAMTAAQVAAAARVGDPACIASMEYSARWAARLPRGLDVYPHGAVQEAAGADGGGCALRVVHFVTAVEPGDVMDFYLTRASAAGYGVRHTLDGGGHILEGRKGGRAYLVHARAGEGGVTEVDLVVSGA